MTVSDAGTVEMHVNDASLAEVLRMLSLQSRRNIVASKEVTGHVTANLYNVTVAQALDAILVSNGYVYREKDNFIYVLLGQGAGRPGPGRAEAVRRRSSASTTRRPPTPRR